MNETKTNGNGQRRTRRKEVSAEILDRMPPVNIAAEHAVLGSMLISPNACCDEVLMEVGVPDFYDDVNATAFGTIEEMWVAGKAIDVTTLHEQLRKRFEADDRDNASTEATQFLARITNSVANAAHAVHYAKIVRDKAVYRTLIDSATEILRDAYSENGDSQTIATTAEQKLFAIQERMVTEPQKASNLLHDALEAMERRRGGERTGTSTGYAQLDLKLGCVRPGELIVVAARPSMGKTAFMLNVVERTCIKHGSKVLFISLEMSGMELMDRLLCSMARVDLNKARSGLHSQADAMKFVAAGDEIYAAHLFVDDNSTLKVSQIATKARRCKRRHGLDLVVIDYLQLIAADDLRAPREQQVALISKQLKAMAKQIGVPVVVVAQLNRQAEQGSEHRPKLSHLRESGSIEQDADVVMFVHREEYYMTNDQREKTKKEGDPNKVIGRAEIIIAKQRNGPVGDVKFAWLSQFARFEELAAERHSEFDEFNEGRGEYD